MECMTTGEPTNFIFVIECVYANSTRIAWRMQKLGGGGRGDGVVIIRLVVVVICGFRRSRLGRGCMCRFWWFDGGGLSCRWYLVRGYGFCSSVCTGGTLGRCGTLFLILNITCSKIVSICCLRCLIDSRVILSAPKGRCFALGTRSVQHVFLDASGATGWGGNTTSSGKTFLFARGSPYLVLCEGKALVDFIHSHQFLFPSSPAVRAHVCHVDRLPSVCINLAIASTLIVPKAILDANDDPIKQALGQPRYLAGLVETEISYHRFVKTTPKPRATKKRSGLPPPPPSS